MSLKDLKSVIFKNITDDFNKNKDAYMFYLYPLVFKIKTKQFDDKCYSLFSKIKKEKVKKFDFYKMNKYLKKDYSNDIIIILKAIFQSSYLTKTNEYALDYIKKLTKKPSTMKYINLIYRLLSDVKDSKKTGGLGNVEEDIKAFLEKNEVSFIMKNPDNIQESDKTLNFDKPTKEDDIRTTDALYKLFIKIVNYDKVYSKIRSNDHTNIHLLKKDKNIDKDDDMDIIEKSKTYNLKNQNLHKLELDDDNDDNLKIIIFKIYELTKSLKINLDDLDDYNFQTNKEQFTYMINISRIQNYYNIILDYLNSINTLYDKKYIENFFIKTTDNNSSFMLFNYIFERDNDIIINNDNGIYFDLKQIIIYINRIYNKEYNIPNVFITKMIIQIFFSIICYKTNGDIKFYIDNITLYLKHLHYLYTNNKSLALLSYSMFLLNNCINTLKYHSLEITNYDINSTVNNKLFSIFNNEIINNAIYSEIFYYNKNYDIRLKYIRNNNESYDVLYLYTFYYYNLKNFNFNYNFLNNILLYLKNYIIYFKYLYYNIPYYYDDFKLAKSISLLYFKLLFIEIIFKNTFNNPTTKTDIIASINKIISIINDIGTYNNINDLYNLFYKYIFNGSNTIFNLQIKNELSNIIDIITNINKIKYQDELYKYLYTIREQYKLIDSRVILGDNNTLIKETKDPKKIMYKNTILNTLNLFVEKYHNNIKDCINKLLSLFTDSKFLNQKNCYNKDIYTLLKKINIEIETIVDINIYYLSSDLLSLNYKNNYYKLFDDLKKLFTNNLLCDYENNIEYDNEAKKKLKIEIMTEFYSLLKISRYYYEIGNIIANYLSFIFNEKREALISENIRLYDDDIIILLTKYNNKNPEDKLIFKYEKIPLDNNNNIKSILNINKYNNISIEFKNEDQYICLLSIILYLLSNYKIEITEITDKDYNKIFEDMPETLKQTPKKNDRKLFANTRQLIAKYRKGFNVFSGGKGIIRNHKLHYLIKKIYKDIKILSLN
jgi:hypothetical protein